jgi:hypothetical protein
MPADDDLWKRANELGATPEDLRADRAASGDPSASAPPAGVSAPVTPAGGAPVGNDHPAHPADVDAYFEALKTQETARRPSWRAGAGRDRALAGERPGAWSSTWQWVVAALITVLLAVMTYAGHGWVQILSSFDLGVHEFGHMVFMWAPTLWVQFAGSFMQVAAPLALGGYFLYRRDRFAVILMVAWAAESLNNVSVYMGDAQRMELPLFGDDGSGAGHDWHNIFTRLDLLESTDRLASLVHYASIVMFVAALGLATWWFLQPRLAARRAA